MDYSIEISNPLPSTGVLNVIPFSTRETTCQIGETINGFSGAQIGVRRETREGAFGGWGRPTEVKEWSHVVVRMGDQVIHEGQADVADLSDGDGLVAGITTTPYYQAAAHDRWYFSQDTRWRTAGDVVAEVVRETTPLLSVASGPNWVDSGVLYQPVAFSGRYLDAILSQVTKDGGADGYPHDFSVGVNRLLSLRPRIPPATAKYFLPFEPGTVTLRRNSTNLVGSVAVMYTPFGGTKQILDQEEIPNFRTRHGGRMRAELIKNSTIGQPAAIAIQRTTRRMRGASQYAGTLKYTAFRGLPLAGGLTQPPELVHCGEWAQFGSFPTLLLITAKKYDANLGSLDLTFESAVPVNL